MIKANCKCKANFHTTRGIQVDMEIDENGEEIKKIAFGDFFDKLGENIITCSKCGKQATLEDDE
jgi:hypothetical protein